MCAFVSRNVGRGEVDVENEGEVVSLEEARDVETQYEVEE